MRDKRIWQLNKADHQSIDSLSKEWGISRAMTGLLVNRGITTPEHMKVFLYGGPCDLQDPTEIPGVKKGAARICDAVKNGEKILLYGDYDADGITGTTLLTSVLRRLGADVSYYIPNRIEEGYGLNNLALEMAQKQGVKLVVSIDCGISSCEEARYAAQLGLELIITDHHQIPLQLPEAYAVINPKLASPQAPWWDLAGVGVAYKMAQAVAALCGAREMCEEYLDLVALGTIADIVPLFGENRILVKAGLGLLAEGKRPGIKALFEVSGLWGREISTDQVGFALAPRLNACGRLSQADMGVELLLTDDEVKAQEMAGILDKENKNRQALEMGILNEALGLVEKTVDLSQDKGMVLAAEQWHPGVIGIVASRLTERFHRPTVVISLENGVGKGSARSIPGFNLYAALDHLREYLLSFGGHEMAAGLSLQEKMIPSFREAFKEFTNRALKQRDLIPVLHVDAELTWQELGEDLAKDIKLLSPFGCQNPSPLFVLRGKKLTGCREVGAKGAHLKCKVMNDYHCLDGIAFQLGVLKDAAASWERCDVVFTPEMNTWNGRSMLQLNIKDMKSFYEPDDPYAALSFMDRLYLEGNIWLEDDYYRDIINRQEFFTKAVGVTFENRQELIGSINDGDKIELRREPFNSHDPFAVGIFKDGSCLGYLNARLARYLSPGIDRGLVYDACITQVTGRGKDTLGLNLCLRRLDNNIDRQELEKTREKLGQMSPEMLWEEIRAAILGEYHFHPKQEEALESLKNGDNSLVIFTTGRGKSAVFQAMAAYVALFDKKVTVIVYPLRSLVNDQYHRLREKMSSLGLCAEAINGSMSPGGKKEFFNKLYQGSLDVILTTPEFLEYHLEKFSRYQEIGFFVVDEAHHLARAKRRGYKQLPTSWKKLGQPLALSVTATADQGASQKIVDGLHCRRVIIENHVRENLQLVDRRNERDKITYLVKLISSGERAVIYVNSRKQAYQLAADLRLFYPPGREKIGYYHGGLNGEDRVILENMFRQGSLQVMVTTSAFGEGIDIPDIQHVVLYHLCFSRAEFNQLSGRAGRDRRDAYIHMIFGERDRRLNEFILESAAPSREVLGKLYLYLREQALYMDPLNITNHQIQEAMQQAGFKSFREQTVSACLAIFEELGLLRREIEENKRYLYLAPRPPEKLDLTDSVRYLEGLEEWEEFQEFADYVLTEEAASILSAVNKPIYPTGPLRLFLK